MNHPVQNAVPVRRRARRSTSTPTRTNDPERTMADILEVATREFAEKGLAGARIDAIAEAMRTSKRMIYYYFGGKEGLYVAVLEEAYRRMRAMEADAHLEDLPPEDALRKLVAHTLDYQWSHPEFVRLVQNENIHRAQYLGQSKTIRKLNVPAIQSLRDVLERGQREGVFRGAIDPVDLHMSISAMAIFHVANRHTFSLIFQCDLESPRAIAARRESIIEMVVRFVRKDGQETPKTLNLRKRVWDAVSPAEMARSRSRVNPVVEKLSARVGETAVAEVIPELGKLRR